MSKSDFFKKDFTKPDQSSAMQSIGDAFEESASESLYANYKTVPYDANLNEEQEAPLWLITFTDIMALMLTFFVLLYSMAVPDVQKWSDLTKTVNEGLSKNKTLERFAGQINEVSIDKVNTQRALDLGYLSKILTTHFEKNSELDTVKLIRSPGALIISLPNDLVFAAGSADTSSEGRAVLFSLAEILFKIRNRIEVIGHADPRPILAGTFDSNWDLSLSRASVVAAILEDKGYEKPITVRGLSSARYDELSGQMDEEERMDLARRVDIVVMKDSGIKSYFLRLGGAQ